MSSDSLPGDNGNTLDRVLAEYVDRMNGGEILDGEKIRSEHPDLYPELRNRPLCDLS